MLQASIGTSGTPRRDWTSVIALPAQAQATATRPNASPRAAWGRSLADTTSGQKISPTPTTPTLAAAMKRRVTGRPNSQAPLAALPNTMSENSTATRPEGMKRSAS